MPKLLQSTFRWSPIRYGIDFDWQIPQHTDNSLRFEVRISRLDQSSATSFAIDLGKLAEADLHKLHDLLAHRPHGYWLARAITWLLDVALKQQMPNLSEEIRHRKVRELLLASAYELP